MRNKIVRRNDFLKMIEEISQTLLKTGKVEVDERKLNESYDRQISEPESLQTMKYIEYGVLKGKYILVEERNKYGLKIKGKNIELSDIAYSLEMDEVCEIISKKFPELTQEEIKAALRVVTIIMRGMECDDFLIDEEEYNEWVRSTSSTEWVRHWLKNNSICLGDKTILRYNNFLEMIEKIIRTILETGELKVDDKEFKESFFRQSSHSPDNLQAMEYIEYGVVSGQDFDEGNRFGLKVKGKNVFLSDVIHFVERNDNVYELICEDFPEVTRDEIIASLRAIRVIMSGLECKEVLEEEK